MNRHGAASWRGRKVLVDGAGGFIGSHLVERLVLEGAEVRAFVRYTSRADQGRLADLPPAVCSSIQTFWGDLRDRDAVTRACKGVDVVFHLGAITSEEYSQAHPVEVLETNILGTLNILIGARDSNVQRVVHTSAGAVYGTSQTEQISENHPLLGRTPHSASKISADKVAESFCCSFGVPVVIVRPFSTYGPRQSPWATIPRIITQVLSGEEPLVLEQPDNIQDFTYVDDTVEGLLAAGAARGVEGETVNLGANDEISVRGVARLVLELIGRDAEAAVSAATRVSRERCESMRLRSDNAKARALLGWEPQVSLRAGLRKTTAWIASRLDRYKPGIRPAAVIQ